VCSFAIISLTLPRDKPQSYITAESTYGTIEDCKAHAKSQSNSFDIVGLMLLTIAITCLLSLVQLTKAQDLKNKSIILILCLAAFLTCSVAFYLNETRWAKNPIIPFSLLKSNKLGLVYGAQIFIGLGQLAVNHITFAFSAHSQTLTHVFVFADDTYYFGLLGHYPRIVCFTRRNLLGPSFFWVCIWLISYWQIHPKVSSGYLIWIIRSSY